MVRHSSMEALHLFSPWGRRYRQGACRAAAVLRRVLEAVYTYI